MSLQTISTIREAAALIGRSPPPSGGSCDRSARRAQGGSAKVSEQNTARGARSPELSRYLQPRCKSASQTAWRIDVEVKRRDVDHVRYG